jgi:hypothetical protein
MQHEVGQQRLQTGCVNGHHGLVAVDEIEFAQKANVQDG